MDYIVTDAGAYLIDNADYPDFAMAVVKKVTSGACERGIMLDGTGIGFCRARNKVKGIRAAVCYDL